MAQQYDTRYVEQILQQVKIAKEIRLPWEYKWKQILDCVDPFDESRDRLSVENSDVNYSPTTQRRSSKYKSAIGGLVRNASTILCGQLLDPSVKWFSLDIKQPGLKQYEEIPAVKNWIKDLEDYIYFICGNWKSNFYPSSHTFIREWYILGTACRYIHIDGSGTPKFDCIPMIKIAFNVNGIGETNFIVRDMNLTRMQAMQLWGEEAIENSAVNETNLLTQKKKYLHVVMENPFMRNPADFPYVGYIIDEDRKLIVHEEYYFSFPYIISRFSQNSGELYGRSPLWYLVNEIEYMDHIINMSRYAAEYAIMPPLKVTSGLTIPQTGIMPGARIIGGLDPTGRSNMEPLMLGGGVNISEQIFEMKRQDINQGLIIQDLFTPDSPNMTATEVLERRQQQDNKIKPIITRWEREDIGPLIHFILRAFERNIAPFPYLEAGILEEQLPAPIEQLEVSYTGILGRQQERYDALMLNSILQDAASLSQMPPYVEEVINLDEVLRFRAKTYDLPNGIMKTREETDQIREAKAQQAQQQAQEMQQQQQLDNTMKAIQIQKEAQGLAS